MQTALLVRAAVSERTGWTPVAFLQKPDLEAVAEPLVNADDLFGKRFHGLLVGNFQQQMTNNLVGPQWLAKLRFHESFITYKTKKTNRKYLNA